MNAEIPETLKLPLKNANGTQRLITKTVLRGVPGLKGQDGKGDDAIVHIKLFTPWSGWTWYVTEVDHETGEAFGIVRSPMEPEGEVGYFNLNEIAALRGPFGVGVERDNFYGRTKAEKMTVGEVKQRWP